MVYDMPGVYKIPMVRMSLVKTDEPAKLRVYMKGMREIHADVEASLMGLSKNFCYEKPCGVTGSSKSTGPELGA